MTKSTIDAVANYVISKLDEAGGGLNLLKLQKLMFYIQAWHLALKGEPMFLGKFQAWVHGPVNRSLYDRFCQTHMMYAPISAKDINATDPAAALSTDAIDHINEILDAYASYSGPQLEKMTHDEDPWVIARGGLSPTARCETEIDEGLMAEFYKNALEQANK